MLCGEECDKQQERASVQQNGGAVHDAQPIQGRRGTDKRWITNNDVQVVNAPATSKGGSVEQDNHTAECYRALLCVK